MEICIYRYIILYTIKNTSYLWYNTYSFYKMATLQYNYKIYNDTLFAIAATISYV